MAVVCSLRLFAGHTTDINSPILAATLMCVCGGLSPDFVDKETETQRHKTRCPSHSASEWRWDWNCGLPPGSTAPGHMEPGRGAGPLRANTGVGEVTSPQLVAGSVHEGHEGCVM